MINYNRINNIAGWAMFFVGTLVYWLTCEPTGSFWDCGEFVSCAYKLQIAHSPGAPLFSMLGHIFTLLSFGDRSKIAVWANHLSNIMGGLTVLFTFWAITALAKKIVVKKGQEITREMMGIIIASGVIGGLACTFADSIWFSAVEGEVYASSSFFTAIVFWAILKWEAHSEEKYADRYILLIAYLMGLSTGVHLLNLLTIPSIVFVYYFKKFKPTVKKSIITFFIACGILGFVQYGIIQYLPLIASRVDILTVNSFHLPFNYGAAIFFILLLGAAVYGIIWAKRKGNYVVHTSLLAFLLIVIGYCSYFMVLIRANADPSINMGYPKDLLNLESYLSREQYGDRPLLTGPYFTSKPSDLKYGMMKYHMNERTGRYDTLGREASYTYDGSPGHETTFFPRIFDNDNSMGHVDFYKSYLHLQDQELPDFSDNLSFFWRYQCNWMFWRYILWNFSGRQDDIEGQGDVQHGNWISGINFIDNLRLGDQDSKPPVMKDNMARNKYFMLPLILGIIGLLYQFQRKRNDFWVVLIFFFFTGLAIVLYLNQTPQQPRERDYAYAGAVYVYCIWIGLGLLALYDWIKKRTSSQNAFLAASCLSLLPVGLMGVNGWNDHDRSNRYTMRDIALDYLESCPPNAVLFTQGDNDTYPLWYAQEVEGIRTDVRIINLSLAGVDWYIKSIHRKVNQSDIVPTILDDSAYIGDNRNRVSYQDINKDFDKDTYYRLSDVVRYMGSDDIKKKALMYGGVYDNYLPTKNFFVDVNRENVKKYHVLNDDDTTHIPAQLKWTFNKGYVDKNDLLLLDIIAATDWSRPICFAQSCDSKAFQGLRDYLVQEGMVFRLTPVYHKMDPRKGTSMPSAVNTSRMYELLFHKFQWGNIDKAKSIYLDETITRMYQTVQSNFFILADALIDEGRPGDSVVVNQAKLDQAVQVLDKAFEVLPEHNLPLSPMAINFAMAYYRAGALKKGQALLNHIYDLNMQKMIYITSLDPDLVAESYADDADECARSFYQGASMARDGRDTATFNKFNAAFNNYQKFIIDRR